MKLTVQNSLKTVQLFQAFIYQGLNYQIIDVIQLNRAKFIFNRSKRKTDIPRERMSAKLSYPDYRTVG